MKNKCIACGKETRAKVGLHGKYCNRHAIQVSVHGKVYHSFREPNTVIKKGKYSLLGIIYHNTTIYTKVDTSLLKDILKYKWSMGSTGYAFYCKTKIRLHQFIMGKKEGLVIDHINHDKLDNRKSNLRHVTFAQNCQNKKIKPIGISWHKKGKKWRAYYRENGITEHLGLFSNKLEAKRALSERKTVSRYNDRGLQIILKGSKVPLINY